METITDAELADRLCDHINQLDSDGMVDAAKLILGLEIEFNEATEEYIINND